MTPIYLLVPFTALEAARQTHLVFFGVDRVDVDLYPATTAAAAVRLRSHARRVTAHNSFFVVPNPPPRPDQLLPARSLGERGAHSSSIF